MSHSPGGDDYQDRGVNFSYDDDDDDDDDFAPHSDSSSVESNDKEDSDLGERDREDSGDEEGTIGQLKPLPSLNSLPEESLCPDDESDFRMVDSFMRRIVERNRTRAGVPLAMYKALGVMMGMKYGYDFEGRQGYSDDDEGDVALDDDWRAQLPSHLFRFNASDAPVDSGPSSQRADECIYYAHDLALSNTFTAKELQIRQRFFVNYALQMRECLGAGTDEYFERMIKYMFRALGHHGVDSFRRSVANWDPSLLGEQTMASNLEEAAKRETSEAGQLCLNSTAQCLRLRSPGFLTPAKYAASLVALFRQCEDRIRLLLLLEAQDKETCRMVGMQDLYNQKRARCPATQLRARAVYTWLERMAGADVNESLQTRFNAAYHSCAVAYVSVIYLGWTLPIMMGTTWFNAAVKVGAKKWSWYAQLFLLVLQGAGGLEVLEGPGNVLAFHIYHMRKLDKEVDLWTIDQLDELASRFASAGYELEKPEVITPHYPQHIGLVVRGFKNGEDDTTMEDSATDPDTVTTMQTLSAHASSDAEDEMELSPTKKKRY